MQILAMVTMLIDHIGIVFFPDNLVWRIVGRIAFPLYAYGIAVGLHLTSDIRRYIKRLAVIGAAAQIPYMFALESFQINVIGTFLFVIGVLSVIDRYKSKSGAVIVVLLAVVLLDMLPFDYGSYAMLLILIYRYVSIGRIVAAHMLLNIVYLFYMGWLVQLVSVVSTILILCMPRFMGLLDRAHVPRKVWLSFYPAHLILLGAIRLI